MSEAHRVKSKRSLKSPRSQTLRTAFKATLKTSRLKLPTQDHSPASGRPTPSRELGALFRDQRKLAGLTEKEVANYLGDISIVTLRAYESGTQPIPLSHIHALSNCLNISPKVLIGQVNRLSKKK